MDIKAEKIELIKLLISVENESVLERIKAILTEDAFTEGSQASDWWDSMPEGVQQMVLAAEKEIEEGKGISHDKVLAMYANRLKRA